MLIDQILQAYVAALLAGFAVLHVYSLPLLGVASSLAFVRGMLPQIRAGIHAGEIWAHVVLMLISVAGYVYLLTHFRALTLIVFNLAQQFGAQVGGLGGSALSNPSAVMEAGAIAVLPITDFIARTNGMAALKNIGVLFQYSLVYDLVLIAFMGIALNVSLTVIELHFSVLMATVLLPWAPLGPTAFLAEFALGWVAGMVVRTLAQTALIGISIPLFSQLTFVLTAGGDPDFWSALGVLLGAALFFILSWLLPNRSARMVAGGLAIAGNDVVAGAAAAARGVRGFASAGSAVVTGASRLIQKART